MNDTTFDVRVWSVELYEGARARSYAVRWSVAGRRKKRRLPTKASAESLRAQLLTAARRGEAFDVESGMPVALVQQQRTDEVTWYQFACDFVDMKWPHISPKHRKGIAEALVSVTPTMLDKPLDESVAKAMRSALLNWGFNARRNSPGQPAYVTELLELAARRSRPLSDIARPEVVRAALTAISTRLDGAPAAGSTATVKRANLSSALSYAVERGYLSSNPVKSIKWRAPRSVEVVDRRSVVNPTQARLLLEAVDSLERSGPRLVAFFATLYYAGLRPEEAVNLRLDQIERPVTPDGWGWLHLEQAAPEVDRQWSDDDRRRSARQLKHRARGEARRVPCAPDLSAHLARHVERWGVDSEGRLFLGERGGQIAGVTYNRLWQRARELAFTNEQYRSPLARRPYDLRHAAVSTWLNGGVDPAQAAAWAGHSVAVLLRIYARCIDGTEERALLRIGQVLRG